MYVYPLGMEPLGLPDIALLVGMVKTGRRSGKWWAMKARTILALATYVDGEWFNAPDVARLTGIEPPLARRILLELEQQHVLDRDGGPAARPQVFWCQVNPDWQRWEVEWSMSRREIEAVLAFNRATRARQPLDRLFARPAGARFWRVREQLSARAFEREKALWTIKSAREQGAQRDVDARARGARKGLTRRQEVSLLRSDAAAESSSSPVDPQEQEGLSHPRWGMVSAVFVRRAEGAKGLWGTPKAHVARLLAEHGPERLLAVIDQAPDGFGPKLLAEELDRALRLDPDEPLPDIIPGVTPLSDAGREHLEQLVATYRADGGEAPEELLSELARWQDGVEDVEEA
jgi:hypothetical protein